MTKPAATHCFLFWLFSLTCLVKHMVSSYKQCEFKLTPDRSIQLTSTEEGIGVTRLRAYFARSLLDCKKECCATERCNTVSYALLEGQAVNGAFNCFLTRCNPATGCQSQARTGYYLYAMDGATVLPPPTPLTPKVSLSVPLEAKNLNSTASRAASLPAGRNETTSTPPTTPTLTIASTHNTRKATRPTTTLSRKSGSYSTFHTSADLVIISTKTVPIYEQIQTTGFANSSFNWGAFSRSAKPVHAAAPKPGILIFLLVIGMIFMIASAFTMWRTFGTVKTRRYKELLILMHDDDDMYA